MASTYNKEWDNLSIEEKRDVIRVALKNGIRELPDIKAKYNEFAGGGSFYQRHRARWNNYLLRHGVPEQQAAKLSSFFSAQDALESGHGTSDAARRKNNFGGMQRLDKKSNKMVNISYPSVDAYMDAKWKMMQNRFGRALNANSIQEYSNLLNDPRYHGKGYMYALYEGYRDGKPLDVVKQTKHMNDYTRMLMDIAGEKGFKGAPVPAGQAGEAPASIARPVNPYTQYTPAEPFFNQNTTFVRPEDVRKAQEENALRMAESQNAAMQQERKQSVDSFNTLMGLLHTPNNSNSGILSTIATLANLNKNNRFDTGGVKQQPRQYIYDIIPSLFAKDGVKITVSSGFRPGAKTVEGKPSRHSLKQAADIVGDFKAIRRVLDDPNSYTSRWLLANGYGYLDETSATGTTKFWHDHKRDHSHYHIGMDSGIVSKYANMMNGRAQNPLPAQQDIVEQPVELAQTPDIPFTPSNPQAFFGVHPAQQQSVYDYVTTPTVEQPVYDPMAEEKNNALSNLSKFNAIMQLTSPSNSGNNNFLNTVGLLANMSAKGGPIHIKPENRGKFTALKERTGHSATWFKEHGTPAQRKMATFALNAAKWKHGYGGHLYDGTTEDTQQMNIPYVGELPDVTVMPRRIANKAWDKVQERWVGDMPTYYAVNPETGKEEMLREIGNGKYSTYDDKHVFDVLGAEAAKKQREQWIRNGGNASDFDKVMLGTLGLGLAPIALPEAATGIWAASQTPAGQTLLAGTLGGEAWEALNHGITGQSWGDNLGDVIGLDKDNYLGRTALGLANPFYGLSPNTVYKGGAAATELGKSLLNAGKEGLQYTVRAADNAVRGMSPSYDLYRTIGETPVSRGSLQKSLTEDFGIFEGPTQTKFYDVPYREYVDDSFNLIRESAESPKQYGFRVVGRDGDFAEVLGKDGKWHGNVHEYSRGRFSDPIDNDIIVGKKSIYQPEDYLFHYDMGNYPIYYNTDGTPMLHRLPDSTGDLGPIWWNKNSKWGDRSITTPRLIKAPDYGKYRQSLSGYNIGDSDAILTGDYPLVNAEFLERDNLVGTMRRGIFAQQPTPKPLETPTIEWAEAARTPQITAENESVQNESIKDMFRRILSGNSDGIKTTEEMAEMGRKDLLDEISSPWYKERWKKATNWNDEQIDDLLSRMRVRITDVPMDYSKTTEQLSGKPGFATYGATVPREPYKFKLSDGTPVTDYNTGLDVQIASDRGVKAQNTAYHELQHYLTNKATGTASYPSLKFIANGPYEPLITPTSNGELLIGRGDAWQHFIMDQNEALLPERSFVYEEAIHSPKKLKKRLVEIGRTPEEADDLILKLKDEAQDMMDIQEERAHLKTWFTKDILPFLKNPNDASEIERVLAGHPDIMENRPEKIKTLMESLRPGSIKDYAKYLAESLGIVPFIVNTNSKEK